MSESSKECRNCGWMVEPFDRGRHVAGLCDHLKHTVPPHMRDISGGMLSGTVPLAGIVLTTPLANAATREVMQSAQDWVNAAEVRAARNCTLRYTGRQSFDPGESIADACADEAQARTDFYAVIRKHHGDTSKEET